MLTRRSFLVTIAGLGPAAVLPAASWAQSPDYAKEVEKELAREGFTQMTIGRTWLGRIHILAKSKTAVREIVVNPHNGEILRDYTTTHGTGKAQEDILGETRAGDAHGSHGGEGGGGSGGDGGSGGGDGGGDGGGGGDGE
ncbi:hypothetical protein U879_16785 [Defluviimonas sp. 20V17]|uniref:PepSY domain-containing protein n=1 Tax=Allgaiera indica TaxID=765699 RepID=A0AAN4ZZU0_9RHOB|nr:hypothetical protein [Allgaiera indica]KDB02514.1 hypothetical protein U879_16785 [Defluviimonas sp. 20V17]GHE01928.1 hypothetical protein GCM10008024_19490 [Allgaiera indica]SDX01938.1 hypothetical protein SAMN05444006_1095 [Allgaiera indica]